MMNPAIGTVGRSPAGHERKSKGTGEVLSGFNGYVVCLGCCVKHCFLSSENTYNWLIGTWGVQEAEKQKLIRDTMDERLKNLYDPFYYDDLRVWID